MAKLLVANRGEIAVRVLRTAADLGIPTVAVHPADDADSLHVALADQTELLIGEGPAAYLNIEAVVDAARRCGASHVHPGYGFLAESAGFAEACGQAGLVFVGPTPETLALFGDKAQARAHAVAHGVDVLRGTDAPTTFEEASSFLEALGEGAAVMVKAVAGGGGRGMRPCHGPDDLAAAMERCSSEALRAFGIGALYVEELLVGARHIEVQIAGDGTGQVVTFGERECSVQRQRQKLVEMAPAPGLHTEVRARLLDAASTLAAAVSYRSIGTFEFLVLGAGQPDAVVVFLECNARIQVEHTVTEEVFGLDLVALQLDLATPNTVDLGLLSMHPVGVAVQARVNLETIAADGLVRPTGGRLDAFDPPTGPGIRVDSGAGAGDTTNPRYDSLLAKVVAHSSSSDPSVALRKLSRALGELRVVGPATTTAVVRAVVERPEMITGSITTSWFEDHLDELTAAAASFAPGGRTGSADDRVAGVTVDASDPLAVLAHGRDALLGQARDSGVLASADSDHRPVPAPMQGTIISVDVSVGDEVAEGQQLAVLEAMKMEHVVLAEFAGVVAEVSVAPGAAVHDGHPLLLVVPGAVSVAPVAERAQVDLDHVRPDLAESLERHEIGLDHRRPGAVARRRRTGQRTARENVADLVDEGSYIEYGPLVIAPQRRRRSVEDLIENTPADGMIAGIGRVNGSDFGPEQSRCVVMSYDYTVLAGTQGGQNHRKKDRLFELAHKWQLPVVFFTEGGGGRPGDTDGLQVAGLDCLAFGLWGELSGLVPLVGINSGYCFAGNAAILGCCDVIIATENSNIGMGGPAMIEGGGLGVYRPTEVGPMDVQRANGVVDITVADEAEAVAVAKLYLSYFQGSLDTWDAADQRLLRHAIPENRLRVYDVRAVVETMFDIGSVLELRPDFGHGMITALARVEGRPVGVLANNPAHLAGAIDSDAADKASRFMQLCDAFDLPIVQLCDTPGFMVGPEAEKTALVRHVSRMFVTARSLTVPTCTIVLRKGYGLGAQAMASGGFKFPLFCVAWPTGEFGGMGLEGAVKLGYRKELEAIEDPAERSALYDELVERMYTVGKGVSMADHFEIDDVIDPLDSRRWITTAFGSVPPPPRREGKKRPMIDTW